ncbi:type I secretion C-terminal target domain-containing protein [Actibacterium ureilyticum]|uniref:type I secretion C-terminal target domain-containing protein n=1 Tax=Actibacterium ureilyticum TaxID=1590614 RepID=UPI000BAAEF76|nr:type I secretion C-terminal target domain-containing protein [Actibacterium ureilyticum]
MDMTSDDMTGTTMHEHSGMIDDLFMPHMATHKAVNNGDWSDPNTWEGGKVPDEGADVYIPAGVTVTYDVYSDTELDFVRVDGTLTWEREADTKMVVDTILTAEGSNLEIGSMHGEGGSDEATPIGADYTAEIVFVDGAIDTSHDPELLTRGIVAWGHVDIMGAEKEPYLVIEDGATKGSKSITVEGDLDNWEIGDTIVLIGTENASVDANGQMKSQDEERTIVAIEGDKIIFDKALEYDHTTPAGYDDIDTYVANSSRNVVFSSENPDGVRGHLMMMNGEVDHGEFANSVLNAEFDDMGRTDKNAEEVGSNVEGRYPIHLHHTGDGDAALSMISGNAVNGGPGWGIVQHNSNAMIMDNFVQDIVGAGIVSELGNEQGAWVGNLVTHTLGHEDGVDAGFGSEGIAYENQSRVIIQYDNIAANSKIGWNWEGNEIFDEPSTVDGAHRKMFERYNIQYDPSPFDEAIDHEEPAINHFEGNESIANGTAFLVFHRQYSDDTDTMSVIKDFTIWGGGSGVSLKNYASNYLFMDSTWIGTGTAMRIERKTSSVVLNDVEIDGFDTGWRALGVNHESSLIDVTFTDVKNEFVLNDLLANVDSASLKNELIKYYDLYHDIDYTNPMPQIIDSSTLTPVDEVVFIPDADADLTLGPGDYSLNITGITIDSVGVRNFNEYVIAKTPKGTGTSKDFEGVSVKFGNGDKTMTLEQFLEIHGTLEKADGTWVVPVVNWITDRLTGDQHPVIIEIDVSAFDESFLKQYELTDWTEPQINNPDFDFGFDATTGEPTSDNSGGSGDHSHGNGGDPVDETPVDETPVDETPVDETPVDETPVDETPVDETPVDETPVDETPVDETPVDETPDEPTDNGDYIIAEGTSGGDKLVGSSEDDAFYGLAGADTIRGRAGDDRLDGGAGKDVLKGDAGADTFVISVIDGNVDNIADFDPSEGDILDLSEIISAEAFTAGSNLSDFVQLESTNKRSFLSVDVDGQGDNFVRIAVLPGVSDLDLDALYKSGQLLIGGEVDGTTSDETDSTPDTGTGGGDTVNQDVQSDGDSAEPNVFDGTNAAETMNGTDAADTMVAFAGDDMLYGYGGNDHLQGRSGDDIVSGGAGDDRLLGNGGNDEIDGGSGDDRIVGGRGEDLLTGGDGEDSFEFRASAIGHGVDTVTDFSASLGDELSFRKVFDGATEDNLSEYVKVTQQGDSTLISVNVDGKGNDYIDTVLLEDTSITLDQLLDADAISY